MSLTARMSAFFLGALAVVLAGFSMTLYLLARTYLHRQVEERLTAAAPCSPVTACASTWPRSAPTATADPST